MLARSEPITFEKSFVRYIYGMYVLRTMVARV